MPQPLQVLIVEDNPADAELVTFELRRAGFAPIWHRVDSESAFSAGLRPDLDVILSDYTMPEFSGIHALKLLQESGLDIPFILISGTIGEETAAAAMKLGATDYLLKDRLSRLGPAIIQAMEQARLRSERRKSDASLALFRTLVDQSSDTFEVIDPQSGRFLDVNENGPAELGITRQEYLSRRVPEIDPTLTEATWRELVEKIRRQGSACGESWHLRMDGTRFPIEFSARWVSLDQDYIVSAVRNITERKKLEQQFLRAQRMENIGMLAGGIAHDLNNVLSPIITSLDLLKIRFPDSASQDLLSVISSSACRGSEMIRQVLSSSRSAEERRIEVQTRQLIEEIEAITHETFLKNIHVRSLIPRDLWPVRGDPTQLHQVLLNLCVNARDAMPGGGHLSISAENLTIDLCTDSEVEPGRYVVIRVMDSGTGIAPEIIDEIFEPFFTTKEIGKGTGLGLATSQAIVKGHGGFIRVESHPGKSTCFSVHLPAWADARSSTPAELSETLVSRAV